MRRRSRRSKGGALGRFLLVGLRRLTAPIEWWLIKRYARGILWALREKS